MIPYVEIIDKTSLKRFAQIEPSQCFFELSYYEIGQCLVYCIASQKNLAALQKGNYLKIPNKRWLWVITSIKYEFSANGTRMITATGFEAKWLLKKRIIETPYEMPLQLNQAIYDLVYKNAGLGASIARRISGLITELSDVSIAIADTQATRGNLFDFVSNLLKLNKCGCQIIYDNETMVFSIYQGTDKTASVRFSQSLDNLLSSSYRSDNSNVGTYAYVVSKVNDIEYPINYNLPKTTSPLTHYTGVDRCEVLINSDLSTEYTDVNGETQTALPTDALYQGWQVEEGKKALANHILIEEVAGQIDLANSRYTFDTDYYLGDLVRAQDEYFNISITTRILKYTISQDANGYAEQADYGE